MSNLPLIPTPKTTNIGDELKKHAPLIAFLAGNGLLLLGEVRVYDYAYTQTGEVWKAWFAVLASFVPFAIWEVAVQHDKASSWMRAFAWLGMIISLGLGIAVGVADFVMIDGTSPDSNWLLGALALSLSVHAILLLAYFYAHPEITLKRLMAQALAREAMALHNAKIAQSILKAARQRLAQERSIANEFGEDELRKVLAGLTGQEYTAPEPEERPTTAPPPTLSDGDIKRIAQALAENTLMDTVTLGQIGEKVIHPNGHNKSSSPLAN